MKKMEIREIWHPDYGRCLQFSNATAILMVTLDYGPRIIHYALDGMPNILFFNRDPLYRKDGPEFDRVFYPGAYWNIRGGNRLWIAPHSFPHAFYPDNEPVEYEMSGERVRFIPQPRRHTGAQISTEIQLASQSSEVNIRHTVRNISPVPQRWAAWSITSVDASGFEIIPMSQRKTGVLPNRHIAYWPYTKIDDPRITLRDKYAIIHHSPSNSASLKIGTNNEAGWASYVVSNQCFTLKYSSIEHEEYPDFGVTYETFEDDKMVEMETLSPLKTLKQGEEISHSETWSLMPVALSVERETRAQIERFADHLCLGEFPNL